MNTRDEIKALRKELRELGYHYYEINGRDVFQDNHICTPDTEENTCCNGIHTDINLEEKIML